MMKRDREDAGMGYKQKSAVLKKGLFSAGKLEESGKVISDKGTEFAILDSHCQDFLSEPLLSLGENTFQKDAREGIILNPQSQRLQLLYDSIKSNLAQENNLLSTLDTLLHRLAKLILYSRPEHLDAVVRQYTIDILSPKKNGKTCNLVPLEDFLAAKTGVCRHQSFMACYTLHRLIKDRHINAVEVHHVRSRIQRGSHSWVMIKEMDDQWIHFDSQWKILRIVNEANYPFLCKKYTKEAIDGILEILGIEKKIMESEYSDTLTL